MVVKIQNNDMSKILEAEKAVIDFSAVWCGPCKMIAPIVDELAEEMGDVSFFNIDVDENPDLAQQFQVMNIPSIFLLKKGEVVDRTVGFQPKEQLKSWIESK